MNSSKSITSEIKNKIFSQLTFETIPPFLIFIFYLNACFTLMRLQNINGFSIFGTIRLPALLTIIVGFGFLSETLKRISNPIFKIIIVLLLVESIRGFFGYLIFENFVLNDALQFFTWRDLFMHLTSIMGPAAYICSFGSRIKKLIQYFVFMGLVLGVWSITHSGKGPGGYIGDENDNCLVLLTLIPIALHYAKTQTNNIILKSFGLIVSFILIGGAIATNSRGGFLGLVAVILILFFSSRNKFLWIAGFICSTLIIAPFVPKQYYDEIYSIKTDSQSNKGTINERLETWGIIFNMWKDPRNILFGVGLSNSKFNLGPYEPANINDSRRSLVGREAHSFYFQILGDLGLWGILVFGLIIIKSFGLLNRIKKESSFYQYRLALLSENIGKNLNKLDNDSKRELTEKYEFLSYFNSEFNYIDLLARALLCSWVGMLVAGIGISVGYYVTFWLLAAISTGLSYYFEKLKYSVDEINRELTEQPSD